MEKLFETLLSLVALSADKIVPLMALLSLGLVGLALYVLLEMVRRQKTSGGAE